MNVLTRLLPAEERQAGADRAARGGPGERSWSSPPAADVEARRQLLCDVPLFGELPPDLVAWIATAAAFRTFAPGDYIVRQGEMGDSVYLIVAGRVQVIAEVVHDGIVTEAALSCLSEGDTVGELSLLDGQPRCASCAAITHTTTLRLDRDAFLTAMQRHWELTSALIALLARRLRRADARLAEQARDPLTGLYSRRALGELYEREVRRAQRAARRREPTPNELALLFVDLDRLKAINDCFGHQMGDNVLRAVARTLTACTRRTDVVARLGGDEFVVLMPDCGPDGAALVQARVRDALRLSPPGPIPFTVSMGSALVDTERHNSFEAALADADRAMYADKAVAHSGFAARSA